MKNAGKLFSLALGLASLLNIFSRLSFAQASVKETTMNVAPSAVAEISSYEQLNVALDRADVIIFSVNVVAMLFLQFVCRRRQKPMRFLLF